MAALEDARDVLVEINHLAVLVQVEHGNPVSKLGLGWEVPMQVSDFEPQRRRGG